MKKLLYLSWMLLFSISTFSQVNVESTYVNSSNRLNSQFTFPAGENVSQDLFFSIGPNGVPQYGQSVFWNLSPGTIGKARHFHVKKGDWDRSGIRTAEEDITFVNSVNHYPVSSTPQINMDSEWIKIGKSWNFSHDNYAIAIISFTNRGNQMIKGGQIKFSYSNNPYVSIPEYYNYTELVHLNAIYPEAGRIVYDFEYKNLEPKEIRYLYIKIDISQNDFKVPNLDLIAEMVGYASDNLDTDDTFPPHDPNSLTLINPFENTTHLGDCDQFEQYPDLHEVCKMGKPYWIECPNPGDLKCPKSYSLNYPYCNEDSERLTYRISCLNDGQGIAKHVEMINTFDIEMNPFEVGQFSYSGSSGFTGGFNYPNVKFFGEEINLPGLSDEVNVNTYDECSAHVVFTIKTTCNIYEEIDAQAVINFFDQNDNNVGGVLTNNVLIVPEQDVYTNYEPACISCGIGDHSGSRSLKTQPRLQWSDSELTLFMERESADDLVKIQIFNISGQLITTRNILPNRSISIEERIDVSNLHTGIFFIAIQSGEKNHVDKFIKP